MIHEELSNESHHAVIHKDLATGLEYIVGSLLLSEELARKRADTMNEMFRKRRLMGNATVIKLEIGQEYISRRAIEPGIVEERHFIHGCDDGFHGSLKRP